MNNSIYTLWVFVKTIRKRLIIACILQFLAALTSIILDFGSKAEKTFSWHM